MNSSLWEAFKQRLDGHQGCFSYGFPGLDWMAIGLPFQSYDFSSSLVVSLSKLLSHFSCHLREQGQPNKRIQNVVICFTRQTLKLQIKTGCFLSFLWFQSAQYLNELRMLYPSFIISNMYYPNVFLSLELSKKLFQYVKCMPKKNLLFLKSNQLACSHW